MMQDACLTLCNRDHSWCTEKNNLHLECNLHSIGRITDNRLDLWNKSFLECRLRSLDRNKIALRERGAHLKKFSDALMIDRWLQEETTDMLKPTMHEKGIKHQIYLHSQISLPVKADTWGVCGHNILNLRWIAHQVNIIIIFPKLPLKFESTSLPNTSPYRIDVWFPWAILCSLRYLLPFLHRIAHHPVESTKVPSNTLHQTQAHRNIDRACWTKSHSSDDLHPCLPHGMYDRCRNKKTLTGTMVRRVLVMMTDRSCSSWKQTRSLWNRYHR